MAGLVPAVYAVPLTKCVRLDPDEAMQALKSITDEKVTLKDVRGKRLLRVKVGTEEYRMITNISGPASFSRVLETIFFLRREPTGFAEHSRVDGRDKPGHDGPRDRKRVRQTPAQ